MVEDEGGPGFIFGEWLGLGVGGISVFVRNDLMVFRGLELCCVWVGILQLL